MEMEEEQENFSVSVMWAHRSKYLEVSVKSKDSVVIHGQWSHQENFSLPLWPFNFVFLLRPPVIIVGLTCLHSLLLTGSLRGDYWLWSIIGSMKTIMMNNEQTAASSVVSAKCDGFCWRAVLHLEHNKRGEKGRYVAFLSQSACGLSCFSYSLRSIKRSYLWKQTKKVFPIRNWAHIHANPAHPHQIVCIYLDVFSVKLTCVGEKQKNSV